MNLFVYKYIFQSLPQEDYDICVGKKVIFYEISTEVSTEVLIIFSLKFEKRFYALQ